jgi:ribosomal protein S18 acetylase RimI-like enzyme
MTDPRSVRSIQTALRQAIADGAERVGPFLVTIDAHATGPFRNFAVPDDDAAPTSGDIAALCAYFGSVDRMPRLEFVAPQPALEQALAEAGFVVDNRLSLLALPAASALRIAPVIDGVHLDEPSEDERLRTLAAMQNEAYGESGVSDADVARFRKTLAAGGAVAAAWDGSGAAVAGGVLGSPRGALAEIYGIAVAADHRRRGLGSAVTAALSRAALDRGVTPYLQCEGPGERRMYEGIGYEKVGELIDSRYPVDR